MLHKRASEAPPPPAPRLAAVCASVYFSIKIIINLQKEFNYKATAPCHPAAHYSRTAAAAVNGRPP